MVLGSHIALQKNCGTSTRCLRRILTPPAGKKQERKDKKKTKHKKLKKKHVFDIQYQTKTGLLLLEVLLFCRDPRRRRRFCYVVFIYLFI